MSPREVCRSWSVLSRVASIGLLAFLSAGPGCVSEKKDAGLPGGLQNKMEELLHRVQYSQGLARLADLRQLSGFGSHATEPVRETMLESDNPQLRSNAIFVLGEIYRLERDTRALELVRGTLTDSDRTVRLEAARSLLEAGDRTGVDELIKALDDPDRGTRIRAFLALRDSAGGRDFGYDPSAPIADRQEAITQVREYYGASHGF